MSTLMIALAIVAAFALQVTVPTISRVLSVVAVGGLSAAARIDIAAIPADAVKVELEIDRQPAAGAWAGMLPLSIRNRIESGHGYMAIVGEKEADEAAGERNELRIAVPGTWAVGDKIRVKARAVDALDVASDWSATTAEVTLAVLGYAPVAVDAIQVDVGDDITVEVTP